MNQSEAPVVNSLTWDLTLYTISNAVYDSRCFRKPLHKNAPRFHLLPFLSLYLAGLAKHLGKRVLN